MMEKTVTLSWTEYQEMQEKIKWLEEQLNHALEHRIGMVAKIEKNGNYTWKIITEDLIDAVYKRYGVFFR